MIMPRGIFFLRKKLDFPKEEKIAEKLF